MKMLKKRRGALAIEFLFVFVLLLIFFIFLFAFEWVIIVRTIEVFTVWRTDRVASVISWNDVVKVREANTLYKDKENDNIDLQDLTKLNTYNNKLGFGDYVAEILENKFGCKFIEGYVENKNALNVTIQHNGAIRNLLKIDTDILYWNCPSQPPKVNENVKGLFDN